MIANILQSSQKVVSIEFEDIADLFLNILSNGTAISQSRMTRSGRGLQASLQCIQSLGDLKAFQWNGSS